MQSDQNNNHQSLFEGLTVPPLAVHLRVDGTARGRQASRCAKADCRQQCGGCLFSPAHLSTFERWQCDGLFAPENAPRDGSTFAALARLDGDQVWCVCGYSVKEGRFMFSALLPYETEMGETVSLVIRSAVGLQLLGWKPWDGDQ